MEIVFVCLAAFFASLLTFFSGFGLGTRSQRYAMIVDDGVVSALQVEAGPGLDVSSAESILDTL